MTSSSCISLDFVMTSRAQVKPFTTEEEGQEGAGSRKSADV